MSKNQIEKLENEIFFYEKERKEYLKEFNFWDRRWKKAKEKLSNMAKFAQWYQMRHGS